MSALEIALGVTTAYLTIGAVKVADDFRASVMDQPHYARHPRFGMTLLAMVLWWRWRSIGYFIFMMAGGFALVWLLAHAIGLFLPASFALTGYGVQLALVALSMAPFLLARR